MIQNAATSKEKKIGQSGVRFCSICSSRDTDNKIKRQSHRSRENIKDVRTHLCTI